MDEQAIWTALQEALSSSLLAGCSLEEGSCFLFFNENPLGQPICLSFHPEASVSLWMWQEDTQPAAIWRELSSGHDSAIPILGCRLRQAEVWPAALQRARSVAVLQGLHPSTPPPPGSPQILLNLQFGMLAAYAAHLTVRTREQGLTLEQLGEFLSQATSPG